MAALPIGQFPQFAPPGYEPGTVYNVDTGRMDVGANPQGQDDSIGALGGLDSDGGSAVGGQCRSISTFDPHSGMGTGDDTSGSYMTPCDLNGYICDWTEFDQSLGCPPCDEADGDMPPDAMSGPDPDAGNLLTFS